MYLTIGTRGLHSAPTPNAMMGLAMINSVGNHGGWFGPSIYGIIKDAIGSCQYRIIVFGGRPFDNGRLRRCRWPRP
jgi:hypothetical protein